jgi:hypothetical protein
MPNKTRDKRDDENFAIIAIKMSRMKGHMPFYGVYTALVCW